jgi:hypothetical protein
VFLNNNNAFVKVLVLYKWLLVIPALCKVDFDSLRVGFTSFAYQKMFCTVEKIKNSCYRKAGTFLVN